MKVTLVLSLYDTSSTQFSATHCTVTLPPISDELGGHVTPAARPPRPISDEPRRT